MDTKVVETVFTSGNAMRNPALGAAIERAMVFAVQRCLANGLHPSDVTILEAKTSARLTVLKLAGRTVGDFDSVDDIIERRLAEMKGK